MKHFFIFIITIYQKVLSFDTGIPKKIGISKGFVCMHYPTCSEYTKQAILKYGIKRGFLLGLRRIKKCRPGNTPTIDPVS